MKIFLCPNAFTTRQIEDARECIDVLSELGHVCSASPEDAKLIGISASFEPKDCDLVVSLGGDGCVLRASQVAIAADKPLFGINSGRLGYLCAMSFADIKKFDEILACSHLEKRILLDVECADSHYIALNDAVLMRDNFAPTLDLTLNIDGKDSIEIRGDGVIISTPTGSTGYNQSAGGPMVHSSADVIAITPLYARYGLTRTLVVGKNCNISITERDGQGLLSVDGNKIGKTGSAVNVSLSDVQLQLYCNTIKVI